MKPTPHPTFGLLAAALSASILAVDLPYYAVAASAALVVLIAVWLVVAVRDAKKRARGGPR
ncbi:hypothetical protein FOF52_06815 [Thermobifida alba]|uniref:Uncharacterized protein n=2 Tax=Thermobifida TaxID=83677 RepID=A0A147KE63_THECS|nr:MULTISPECIES: hypothetical protein [Thermobifida]KUP95558.1 hypothetical protein AC529_16895 [Thermobifida cellulosilytica TB100]UPT20708.1 hypothetical protein FOF52_06815 [Thermobifida alba]HLU96163.1 hypothetical protein [Thermobifida alba]